MSHPWMGFSLCSLDVHSYVVKITRRLDKIPSSLPGMNKYQLFYYFYYLATYFWKFCCYCYYLNVWAWHVTCILFHYQRWIFQWLITVTVAWMMSSYLQLSWILVYFHSNSNEDFCVHCIQICVCCNCIWPVGNFLYFKWHFPCIWRVVNTLFSIAIYH